MAWGYFKYSCMGILDVLKSQVLKRRSFKRLSIQRNIKENAFTKFALQNRAFIRSGDQVIHSQLKPQGKDVLEIILKSYLRTRVIQR